jgi:5-methylcytosine-specific restriction endonuclease McrA
MGWSKRRWNRNKYPEEWERISYEFRSSKDFTCESCGYRQGDLLVSRAGRLYRGTVDAAHKYPNDTRNPQPELYCFCKRCHRLYDNQFQALIAEGKHVAKLHAILVQNRGYRLPAHLLTYYEDCPWCYGECEGHV